VPCVRSRFSSLRVRVVLLVVVATLPGLVTLLVIGAMVRRQLARQAQAEATQVGRLIAEGQQRLIDSTEGVLTAFARQPGVLELAAESCEAAARHIRAERPLLVSLHASTPNGDVFCSGAPRPRPIFLGDRAHFREARDNRRFSGGDLVISRLVGVPVVTFSAPAIDDAGVLRAVVTAAVDASGLARALGAVPLPPGATARIADRSGVVIATVPARLGDAGPPVQREADQGETSR
jgi:hypothetical protein